MYFQKPPLGTPLDWSNPLNDGVALHLAMNEGHGDVVRDLSMNGNHGILHNFAYPPTVLSGWNPSHDGIGLKFKAAGSCYVECGNNYSLDVSDSVTFSAIIQPTTVVGEKRMIMKENSYYFGLDGGNLKYGRWGIVAITDTAGITLDGSHWVTVTYDKTDWKSYHNGNLIKSTADGGSIPINTNDLQVGRRETGVEFFGGFLDQVRIIQGTAWTPKEVKDYYINPWQVYLDE